MGYRPCVVESERCSKITALTSSKSSLKSLSSEAKITSAFFSEFTKARPYSAAAVSSTICLESRSIGRKKTFFDEHSHSDLLSVKSLKSLKFRDARLLTNSARLSSLLKKKRKLRATQPAPSAYAALMSKLGQMAASLRKPWPEPSKPQHFVAVARHHLRSTKLIHK